MHLTHPQLGRVGDCRKCFKSEELLIEHQKDHLGQVDGFQCDHCDKKFTKQFPRTRHVIRIHQNVKRRSTIHHRLLPQVVLLLPRHQRRVGLESCILLVIIYSLAIILTALVKYWYQSKNLSISLKGQYCLGLYMLFVLTNKLTTIISLFATTQPLKFDSKGGAPGDPSCCRHPVCHPHNDQDQPGLCLQAIFLGWSKWLG